MYTIYIVHVHFVHVIVRTCLLGLYREYTQHYCVIPRAAPSGLRNSAECIH